MCLLPVFHNLMYCCCVGCQKTCSDVRKERPKGSKENDQSAKSRCLPVCHCSSCTPTLILLVEIRIHPFSGKEVKEVRPPLPQVAKATSFSQLAGMPVAPIVQPVSQKPNMRRGVSAGNVMPSTAPAPTSSKRPSDDTAFAPLPTATLRRPTNEA